MAAKGKKVEVQVDVKGQEQWDDLLAKEGLIVVDAYAGWCGPCKAIESTFRRIRNENGGDLLHFATAETDNIESLAMYREKSRPTFLFYGGGQLVHVIRGCNAPFIIKAINTHLKEEQKIMNGEGERKPFVDVEVQQQETVIEEKQDDEKSSKDEEDEDQGDIFARFIKSAKATTEVVEVPKEISVAIIKPDALKNGHAEEIIRSIEESGIEILHQEEKILSKEEAAEFYKQHEGSDHFEQLIDFMSSGPVLTLVLSKKGDDAGYGLIPELRDMIGPKDVNLAKEEAPQSIRAQYGTDAVMNAVHACDTSESAARELAFFFPDFNVPKVQEKRRKKRIQRTLALIRPDAYARRKESVIAKIEESGFTVAMSKEMQLTREQAEEFYSDHKDEDYFESLITNMTSGPTLALCLAREDAVEVWRNMLGPKDVAEAKEVAPDSLRAIFADEEATINPIHGAETVEAAEKELHKFFPLQSTVAVIKPDVYSIPEQREQIVDTIQQSGFKISAQKEINLTKELAAQFYKEHEGKEFFNGLTDYMSSGPTLFLILSREDAIPGFRALVGPTDPEKAKEEAPNSLRALYATDSMHNAVHSSSNKEKATEIIEEFFPEIELNPDGTVKEPLKEDKTKKEDEGEPGKSADGEAEPTSGEAETKEGEQPEGEQQTGEQQQSDQQEGDQSDQKVDGDQTNGAQQAGDEQQKDDSNTGAQEATGAQDATSDQEGTNAHSEGDQPSADATKPADGGSNEESKPSGDESMEGGETEKNANEAEVNNNEAADAKPEAENDNKQDDPEPSKQTEGEANTNEDAKSVSNEETPNESNTPADNNGDDSNNNGEDSNNETGPSSDEAGGKDIESKVSSQSVASNEEGSAAAEKTETSEETEKPAENVKSSSEVSPETKANEGEKAE